MAVEPRSGQQTTPVAKLDYETSIPKPKGRSLFVQIVCLLIGLMAVLYGGVALWRVVAVLFGY